MNLKLKIDKGFSLVEVLIAATIFSIVAVSVYQSFATITTLVSVSRDKVTATSILNEEFEVVRNMSFSKVGLTTGIPKGILSATTTLLRDGRTFVVTRTIRNIDDPFDGTIDGTPDDLSPADYKMVDITIACDTCKNFTNVSGVAYVAPKNLETASTNGALFVKVFDANGVPIQNARVQVINSAAGVSLDEVTDNTGTLAVVDAPPGSNAYRIIASKTGFTTDRTYATSSGNPNPTKPDATVLLQQVTQISFVIDKVSTVNVQSKDLQCAVVANVPFTLSGAKLIGTNPDVLKFSGSFVTDSSGLKTLNDIEWDTFILTVDGAFNLAGVNPPSPFSVLPDSTTNVDIIIADGDPNNLLVSVKDNVTQLPLSGVSLTLTQGSFLAEKITGRGYLEQTDWSGGSGQANFIDETKYFSDDTNIDTASPTGELKLKKVLGDYALSGNLTSSVFDTGTSSNFTNIIWNPTDQPPQSGSDSVRFQLATSLTNTATTTWNYVGPDGTSGTYFTLSDNNINAASNGHRYFRYKIFLSTLVTNKTPNVANVAVTYTSDCIPPGQALFSGLSSGNHDLLLERTGYQSQEFPVNIITNDDWQSIEALMSPQ